MGSLVKILIGKIIFLRMKRMSATSHLLASALVVIKAQMLLQQQGWA